MSREPLNEAAYLETKIILDVMNSPLIADNEVVSRLPEACIVSCEYDVTGTIRCCTRRGWRTWGLGNLAPHGGWFSRSVDHH